MNIYKPALDWYVQKLREEERFSFVRYGNGEWECMLNLHNQTRSGSQAFNRVLRESMQHTLLEPRKGGKYYYATQSTSYLSRLGLLPKAKKWMLENGVRLSWHDGEVFHKASRKGQLYPLIEAMKKYRVIVVGPQWLMSLPFSNTMVPIRSRNCWQDRDKIFNKLKDLKGCVISFSAGPATKVLMHRLYPVIGNSCWMIDFGSLWDPYGGVRSRKYHKRMKPAVIKRNLTGK